MTLQELKKQALELPTSDRWSLVQILLDSLKQQSEAHPKRGNLSRLRGIAQPPAGQEDSDPQDDYLNYLIEKYQ